MTQKGTYMRKLLETALRRIRSLRARIAATAALAATGGFALPAAAQFSAITSQDVDNLVGVSTSGSETGVYEIIATGETLVPVLVGFVIAVTGGFYLVRWIYRMFSAG